MRSCSNAGVKVAGMTERPSESSGLQSGDPLRDAPESPPRAAPEAPAVPGYTTMPPPGAGGPPATAFATEPVAGRYTLSGWWRRVGAAVVDGLIVGVGGLALVVAITAPFSVGFFAGEEFGIVSLLVGLVIAVVCVAVIALLYAPAMMARTNGKTLGRMATGIRVVRAGGEPITFGFAMLREVAVKTLLFGIASSLTAGLASLADVLWPLWDEENRALHDFIVNTRVVLD
jgi:uncharacterized RDD family membrane protein YckC